MDYSFFIEYLKQKQYLTDLEKDILDTWNELQKNPIDCSAAQRQVLQMMRSILRFSLQSSQCRQQCFVLLSR